jgi:hypothetical protein
MLIITSNLLVQSFRDSWSTTIHNQIINALRLLAVCLQSCDCISLFVTLDKMGKLTGESLFKLNILQFNVIYIVCFFVPRLFKKLIA